MFANELLVLSCSCYIDMIRNIKMFVQLKMKSGLFKNVFKEICLEIKFNVYV